MGPAPARFGGRGRKTNRAEIENRAQQWTAAIESDLEATPTDPEDPAEDIIQTAGIIAHRGADRQDGGWGSVGPKFPQNGRLHALLRAYADGGQEDNPDVGDGDAGRDGGRRDVRPRRRRLPPLRYRPPVDGSALREDVVRQRRDSAGLPRCTVHRLAPTTPVVRETFEFVQRELRHPDGGFFSTLDAESAPHSESRSDSEQSSGESPRDDPDGETKEGLFYVWTPEQVHDAVDDETDADIFCDYYGVTDRGNFEGATVLAVRKPVPVLAEEYERSEDEITASLQRALNETFEARKDRPRPARDEKVLAGWNGLMIRALAEGAIVLDDQYTDVAADALSFVREHLWDADAGRLNRRYKDDDVAIDGYLEDYAFLGRGALTLFEATGDVEHIAFARTSDRNHEPFATSRARVSRLPLPAAYPRRTSRN